MGLSEKYIEKVQKPAESIIDMFNGDYDKANDYLDAKIAKAKAEIVALESELERC